MIPSLPTFLLRGMCGLAASLLTLPSLAAMDHTGNRPFDPRVFAATEAPGGLPPGSFVPDFRLTDHTGTTRELYYESTTKAVVVVFTGTGHPRALQTAAALRALRAKYNAATLTLWQVDSNLATSPAVVAAEQALYNNDTPVLLDDAQIVAAEYGATSQLEAFVINPANWTLAYRGPLDNAAPSGLTAPTQNYVADAVAALVAGTSPAAGTRVTVPAGAVALDLPTPAVPDYATEVAPIVLRRCVSCHSPGNIAPHIYGKFSDLADKAPAIRQDMLLKKMSPWHADSRYGAWANNAALTPAEAAALSAWARAGAPRGTSATDPLATAPAPAGGDWPLGTPDLVLSLPKQSLPARGTVEYQYPELTIPTTEDKWLRAVYVKPGNRRVLHHALVLEGSQVELILQALTTGALPGLNGFFAGYVPGLDQTWFPDGSGKLLKKGAKITVQMHYTTTGAAETDETQVGFYFTPTAPARELLTKSANNINLSIPPGAKDYEREATFTPSATKDVMLYELNPHMHYRGKRVRFDALYPDGTVETLLNVPQYDFNWQSQYRLAQPKRLPAGTAIRIRGAFDNSAQNPFNPNPRATVTFGEQTTDEMYIGYVNYSELPDKATAKPPVFASTTIARARVGETFRLALAAANSPTSFRADALPAGVALDAASGVLSGTPTAAGRRAIVVTATNAAGSAATIVDLIVSAPTAAPVFTQQPLSVRTYIGAPKVTITAAASGTPKPTFTWFFKGSEFCNTSDPILELTDITAAYAGDFTCVATNAAGTVTSAAATLSLDFNGLVNLSARANVGTGINVVIPGIAVRGPKPKTLLIRAAGPALTGFGVPGALANPLVTVFSSTGQPVLVNDNWGGAPDVAALKAAATAQGAFSLVDGSLDSALLATLAPDTYTIQVSGVGTAGTGVALVEVYEVDATPSTLVNLSCRARVGATDADYLTAGFVLRGSTPRRLLIRGVGPTLTGLGVTGALADPKLEIFRQGTAAAIATNDNWATPVGTTTTAEQLSTAFTSVGAFGLSAGSKDAALIVTLPPGTYTAQVSGVNATTGIAIVEVYDLP